MNPGKALQSLRAYPLLCVCGECDRCYKRQYMADVRAARRAGVPLSEIREPRKRGRPKGPDKPERQPKPQFWGGKVHVAGTIQPDGIQRCMRCKCLLNLHSIGPDAYYWLSGTLVWSSGRGMRVIREDQMENTRWCGPVAKSIEQPTEFSSVCLCGCPISFHNEWGVCSDRRCGCPGLVAK